MKKLIVIAVILCLPMTAFAAEKLTNGVFTGTGSNGCGGYTYTGWTVNAFCNWAGGVSALDDNTMGCDCVGNYNVTATQNSVAVTAGYTYVAKVDFSSSSYNNWSQPENPGWSALKGYLNLTFNPGGTTNNSGNIDPSAKGAQNTITLNGTVPGGATTVNFVCGSSGVYRNPPNYSFFGMDNASFDETLGVDDWALY